MAITSIPQLVPLLPLSLPSSKQLLIFYQGIFCSFGDPSSVLSPYTHLIRVGGCDFDLEKLCLLEELALDICQKRINCSEVGKEGGGDQRRRARRRKVKTSAVSNLLVGYCCHQLDYEHFSTLPSTALYGCHNLLLLFHCCYVRLGLE